MILSLGLGQPSYVPDALLGTPRDDCDLQSVAFLQCYVREYLQWDLICYFSTYRHDWRSLEEIAAELDEPIHRLADSLGALAGARLLEERVLANGPIYRLTEEPELRRATLHAFLRWNQGAVRYA